MTVRKDTRRECDRKNTAEPRSCVVCGTVFTPSRKHKDAIYCSKSCVWKATKGPEFNARVSRETAHKRAEKMRQRGTGYTKVGSRHEHRIVAEQMLGRPLAPDEIVHHIDGNKRNNTPENLAVMTQSMHMREHGMGIPGVTPAHKPWLFRRKRSEGNV